MDIQPQQFVRRDVVWAMKFSTNNENGSPTMDAIVNWMNQGKDMPVAWHNGTNIFLCIRAKEDSRMFAHKGIAQVGEWIVSENGEFSVWPHAQFESAYAPLPQVHDR